MLKKYSHTKEPVIANALHTFMAACFLVCSSAGIAEQQFRCTSPATDIDKLKHTLEAACINAGLEVVELGSHHVKCAKVVGRNDALMSVLPGGMSAYGQPTSYIAFVITNDGAHLTTSVQRWIGIKDPSAAASIANTQGKLQKQVVTAGWEAQMRR